MVGDVFQYLFCNIIIIFWAHASVFVSMWIKLCPAPPEEAEEEEEDIHSSVYGFCWRDCSGAWRGLAKLDSCDTCVGGSTGLPPETARDCSGQCRGDFWRDSEGNCLRLEPKSEEAWRESGTVKLFPVACVTEMLSSSSSSSSFSSTSSAVSFNHTSVTEEANDEGTKKKKKEKGKEKEADEGADRMTIPTAAESSSNNHHSGQGGKDPETPLWEIQKSFLQRAYAPSTAPGVRSLPFPSERVPEKEIRPFHSLLAVIPQRSTPGEFGTEGWDSIAELQIRPGAEAEEGTGGGGGAGEGSTPPQLRGKQRRPILPSELPHHSILLRPGTPDEALNPEQWTRILLSRSSLLPQHDFPLEWTRLGDPTAPTPGGGVSMFEAEHPVIRIEFPFQFRFQQGEPSREVWVGVDGSLHFQDPGTECLFGGSAGMIEITAEDSGLDFQSQEAREAGIRNGRRPKNCHFRTLAVSLMDYEIPGKPGGELLLFFCDHSFDFFPFFFFLPVFPFCCRLVEI